jgi:hypothetical protein
LKIEKDIGDIARWNIAVLVYNFCFIK